MPLHDPNLRMVTSCSDPDIISSVSKLSPPRMQSGVPCVTASGSRLLSVDDSNFVELRCSSFSNPQTAQNNIPRRCSPLLSSNRCFRPQELVENLEDFIELDINTQSMMHLNAAISACPQTSSDLHHSLRPDRIHPPRSETATSFGSVTQHPTSLEETYRRSRSTPSTQNDGSCCDSSDQAPNPLPLTPNVHPQTSISQEMHTGCESEVSQLSDFPGLPVPPVSIVPSSSLDHTSSPDLTEADISNHTVVSSQKGPPKDKSNQSTPPIYDDASLAVHPSMLLQTSELVAGGSLICTVVNILRGLRLLDRCGLEDLCASLYGLQSLEPLPHVYNHLHVLRADDNFSTNAYVTRSSSFTSPALVSPRRSMYPTKVNSPDVNAQRSSVSSVHSHGTCGCIAHFVLSCSLFGSSLPPTYNRFSSSAPPQEHLFGKPCTDNVITRVNPTSCLRSVDWKRGCSSNLATLLSSGSPSGLKRPSVAISRLLTGRFLPGPNSWRTVWPHASCSPSSPETSVEELSRWISCWIRRGAVIVLAEFEQPNGCSKMNDSHLFDTNSVVSELVWRHRLVYGITRRNEIFLSNPAELVPVEYVLQQLSLQTTIHLEKSHLAQLWHEHNLHHMRFSTADSSPPCSPSSHSECSCSGDFSLLACQQDRRWNEMNVLGQVLQTLRGMNNGKLQKNTPSSTNSITSCHSIYQKDACLSPTIVIPSSQSPGFSVFLAKSDWKLVHALYQPVRWF